MTQNIYDQPEFFAGYAALKRSVDGLDGAPEWPALRALLPPVRGLAVADLGCGYGWFSRWAANEGAASVHAVDISERMLQRARGETDAATVTYQRQDLETLELQAGRFDLIYSSLAFHYVADARRLYRTVSRALVPGGRLVFSTEHPVFMAATDARWIDMPGGGTAWPVAGYSREGTRISRWLGAEVVKHHRTIGTTHGLLAEAGFSVERLIEFCPSPQQIAEDPALACEADRPMFLLVSAVR